ncbi:MAG: hypothetical protein EZS28_022822, partial [Streblomastix strix]
MVAAEARQRSLEAQKEQKEDEDAERISKLHPASSLIYPSPFYESGDAQQS